MRKSFESVRDRGARIVCANQLSQFGTKERESFESVQDQGARIILVSSRPRSANHLSQFGSANRLRESVKSVRDHGARIVCPNQLSQIGTAERESFESDRDRESFESVRERESF